MKRPSQDLNKRIRAMSAKAPSTRSRPMSSYTSKNFQKTQGLQNIYMDTSPNRKNTQKSVIYQGINTQELAKYKRPATFMTTKDKEQLYDENIKLKRENNKLQEQLMILRGKFQSKGKKTKQRNKQLQVEFEKPLFWGGSKTHLISGIKYQYDKLQQDYVHIQKQLANTKAQLFESRGPELEIYTSQLQKENFRIKNQLQNILKAQSTVPNEGNKQMLSYLYAEAEQNKRKVEQKLMDVDMRLNTANETVKDKQKKIAFMEKLIIQKDNRGYHLHRKSVRLQKQLKNRDQTIQSLNQEIEELKKNHQYELEKNNQLNTKKIVNISQSLSIQIQQRDKKIRQLQEDSRQMENMINKLRMGNSANILNSGNRSMVQMRKDPKQMTHTALFSPVNNDSLLIQNRAQNYNSALSQYVSEKAQQVEALSKRNSVKERVMQTAEKRYSSQAVKLRKVDHAQVSQIGQFLRYKMIGYDIDISKLRRYFDFAEQNQNIAQKTQQDKQLSPQQQQIQWKKQYITMKQTQKILVNYPFELPSQQAHLLSRYIIEDANTEYVYCDENNENKRQIVKSIMKYLMGSYNIADQKQILNIKDFYTKYASNLESALTSYYPAGIISYRKFIDVFSSLGYEDSNSIVQLMLGKMAKHSNNLNQFQYRCLFKQEKEDINN